MSITARKPQLKTDNKIDPSFFYDDEKQGIFIASNIFKLNRATVFYLAYIVNIAVSFIINYAFKSYADIDSRMWIIAVNGGLLTVLIPFHVIHEISRAELMKRFGSATVAYIWSWRQLVLRIEYKDISKANTDHLRIANSIPFLLFSIIPLLVSFLTKGPLSLYFMTVACFHAIYSIRGFSLLSYLYRNQKMPFTKSE